MTAVKAFPIRPPPATVLQAQVLFCQTVGDARYALLHADASYCQSAYFADIRHVGATAGAGQPFHGHHSRGAIFWYVRRQLPADLGSRLLVRVNRHLHATACSYATLRLLIQPTYETLSIALRHLPLVFNVCIGSTVQPLRGLHSGVLPTNRKQARVQKMPRGMQPRMERPSGAVNPHYHSLASLKAGTLAVVSNNAAFVRFYVRHLKNSRRVGDRADLTHVRGLPSTLCIKEGAV
mmetsp:Transcript_36750/g.65796  ORF Transcript_36750/g.65796 Transcript_36750/m.65796 type:complete len:236 (+) Transcript_36750:625-1332(+)